MINFTWSISFYQNSIKIPSYTLYVQLISSKYSNFSHSGWNMDFVRSHFFPTVLQTSWTLFHHFLVPLVLHCYRYPKVMKKCSTGQGYIQKEVTSYKIHTLVIPHFQLVWTFGIKNSTTVEIQESFKCVCLLQFLIKIFY